MISTFGYRKGVPVESFPWRVHQFNTCMRGVVYFLEDGDIRVWLEHGRYPKLVGLLPQPKRNYSCKVCAIQNYDNTAIVINQSHHYYIDEPEQEVWFAAWASKVCTIPSKDLQDFVLDDTLLLCYTITVT